MTDFAKKLGKAIKLERIRRDMNQDDLAEKAEINQSHLSKIEKGTVNISVIMLRRIAEAFDCSVTVLLDEADK